jgi:hypothetical protein
LLPTFIKVAHALENHTHNSCTNTQTTHFHKYNLDCDFYKFNTVTQFFIDNNHYSKVFSEINNKESVSDYFLLNSHRQLSFSLRAPPFAFI